LSGWLIAAAVLMAANVPLAALAFRGAVEDALVALELAGMVTSLALLATAEGLSRQPFADLALVLAVCSFVGALAFARFLELGERED
jgi:multicomponent Na+:H+ antiporter subunit F